MAATAVSAALVVAGNLLAELLAVLGRSPSSDRCIARSHEMNYSRSLLADSRARFGLAVLALVALIAIAAPLLAGDPSLQRDIVATRFLPPFHSDLHGTFHLLGTDRFGRDVWARLAFGARISLSVGVLAVLLVVIGTLIGAVAGFWPGLVGTTLLGLTDFALALPRVVLLLLLASLWQPSAALVIAVLGVTGSMTIARLVHGEVRSLAASPFVESAIALGVRGPRVLVRHITNALTPVIVAAALGIGNAIMLEAGLSFLGLGVQPPTPSWGNLIASGRDTLVNAPWVATAPGVALVLVVVAATLLGDAVRDRLDPSQVPAGSWELGDQSLATLAQCPYLPFLALSVRSSGMSRALRRSSFREPPARPVRRHTLDHGRCACFVLPGWPT